MAVKHDNIIARVFMQLCGPHFNFWQLDQGGAWVGAGKKYQKPAMVKVGAGDVVVRGGRFLKFGMRTGADETALDVIGYERVTITQDMVGMVLPLYKEWDAKTKGDPHLSTEQKKRVASLTADGVDTAVIMEGDTEEDIKHKLTFRRGMYPQ